MNPKEIKEKIRQAEESVAGMQDESLKKIAFETILSQILGTPSSNAGSKPERAKEKTVKKIKVKRIDNGKVPVEHISTIDLNVEQLKDLKQFYDLQKPDGQEQVVFAIAYFIHEKLGLKKFHHGDIHLIYQNLLPLKPITRPPALSLEEIKRAARWLVAPSRKRQWLKDLGSGMYEISSQGMLKMTYDANETKE